MGRKKKVNTPVASSSAQGKPCETPQTQKVQSLVRESEKINVTVTEEISKVVTSPMEIVSNIELEKSVEGDKSKFNEAAKQVERMSECWLNAVVVYVVGQNPTLNAISQYVKSHWQSQDDPQIFKHDEGYFIVRMKTREERDKILFSGPHLFYGKAMIVKQWSANFNFHEEVQKVIPIWVKLPNLPLNCWGEDSLSRIGSVLGVPLYADECTSKGLRVSYARMLVEMDVTQEIPITVAVEDPNGVVFKQKLEYDWVPHFCKKCQMVGHNCGGKSVTARVVQRWIPKQKVPDEKIVAQHPPISDAATEQVVEVMVHDHTEEGNVVSEETTVTPIKTPVNIPDAEEGEWRLVTRKTKDKGKQVYNQSGTQLLFGSGLPGSCPGGARGPNPYLS
uniref:DUF4283 domain-containing protein n=1 Tax=Beta vulgaris subsp. vulgaris TaxID=3555 RepID=F4NCG2_BETVV|nr:hypothetical protein [Beta vulgaris subsp. vulgaris]